MPQPNLIALTVRWRLCLQTATQTLNTVIKCCCRCVQFRTTWLTYPTMLPSKYLSAAGCLIHLVSALVKQALAACLVCLRPAQPANCKTLALILYHRLSLRLLLAALAETHIKLWNRSKRSLASLASVAEQKQPTKRQLVLLTKTFKIQLRALSQACVRA